MITFTIKDKIVHIKGQGGFTYQEFEEAIHEIMHSGEEYIGFISDGSLLKGTNAFVLKKCSAHHKTHHAHLPHASVFKSKAMVILGNTYLKFTNAVHSQIFFDQDEALSWIRKFNGNHNTDNKRVS